VLRQLGFEPHVEPVQVDEAYAPGETPREHVERLARAKAEAVARATPDALVVGGDTIVVDGERVLFKPVDADAAIGMLVSLSGRSHAVLSGIALSGAHGTVSAVSRAEVHMRAYDADVARRYVSTGEPLDKAGAYGIQGLGASLVEGIEGDYYCVVGFPVRAFLDLLERAGWRYEFGSLTRVSD
jgi:septum formation protein